MTGKVPAISLNLFLQMKCPLADSFVIDLVQNGRYDLMSPRVLPIWLFAQELKNITSSNNIVLDTETEVKLTHTYYILN